MEQAIDWMVRLDSDRATAGDRQRFAQWLAASGAHASAWEHLQARLHGASVQPALAQLRGGGPAAQAGVQALAVPVPTVARRRALQGGLAGLLLSVGAGWLLHRQTPLGTLSADLRTGTGERGRHALPDGSTLTLDARSAVDVLFSDTQRLLRLRAGAVIVAVAPWQGAGWRPFVVQSAQGSVQALGTRYMVRQEDERTLVHVMEHSVRITTLSGRQYTLEEGATAYFSASEVTPVDASLMAAAAWVGGVVQVRDQPLGVVIDALRPYQPGLIRVSAAAARLRVFGRFSLDRPDRVLQDLVDTQPITVVRWSDWLMLIDLQAQGARA